MSEPVFTVTPEAEGGYTDHGRRREPPSVNDNLRALGVTW
jgi:hypothetical protein